MDKTIHAAQVDEHTVAGDVLDGSFEHLAFFELGDDFAFLLLELDLDECLVADNDVLVFLVDLDNLEFHGLAHEHIIVADRTYIDLRSGKECFDSEYIHDHTALGAALDVALDDFVFFQSLVDAFP